MDEHTSSGSQAPTITTENTALSALAASLDEIVIDIDPEHVKLGAVDGEVDEEFRRKALLSRVRSCVVKTVQLGGRDDLRKVAIAIGDSLQGRYPTASPESLWARLDELAQIPSSAAARVGPSTIDQTLRGWRGKSQKVVDMVARRSMRRSEIITELESAGTPIGDLSAMSKILTELDEAGLIRRWKMGREIHVEITALGREHASHRLVPERRPAASRKTSTELYGHRQSSGQKSTRSTRAIYS